MSKWPVFDVKNRLFKTDVFAENAYLNPIVFSKKSIFGHFDEKHHFLVTFQTPLVLTVFSVISTVSEVSGFP